jgi:hypothetical protein
MRPEDAALISRDAPNLDSLTLILSEVQFSREYYEKIGHELCLVKTLTFYGDGKTFQLFLGVFLSNHSLFRHVTSLRLVSHSGITNILNFSNKSRPQCTISQHTGVGSRDQWCFICWERRTADWTCPRCNCFVFALRQ